MGDVLSLIGAFIAFALTMVALTGAVSALLGIVQRTFRWRAAGLRHLIVYLYRNEIVAALARIAKEHPPASRTSAFQNLWDNPSEGRAQFLVDMTLLPIERLGAPGTDPRLAEVGGYSWTSLACAADALTDEEFITRMRASEVGRAIAERLPSDDAAKELARFAAKFAGFGRAASESFARRSRVWTVALGYLLAIGLNVDTFNVLARYMANPSLAAAILEQQQKILAGTPEGGAPASPGTDAEIGKALAESRRLAVDASRTLVGPTNTFPIGWTLYPNCTKAANDPRCLALRDRAPAPPAEQPIRSGFRAFFASIGPFLDVVGAVANADPSGFLRWLAGIVVTGALLGLGTPFWVEVLNNFLRARNLIYSFRNVATASDGEIRRSATGNPAAPRAETLSTAAASPAFVAARAETAGAAARLREGE
jgi:hypothetical protein